MKYKYLLLIFLGLLFLQLTYATNITGCQAINSSHLNDTLVLQNNLNESMLSDSNACFYLVSDFSGANLTIDCNNHNISINADNVSSNIMLSSIFSNYWVENEDTMHSFSLDELTLKIVILI